MKFTQKLVDILKSVTPKQVDDELGNVISDKAGREFYNQLVDFYNSHSISKKVSFKVFVSSLYVLMSGGVVLTGGILGAAVSPYLMYALKRFVDETDSKGNVIKRPISEKKMNFLSAFDSTPKTDYSGITWEDVERCFVLNEDEFRTQIKRSSGTNDSSITIANTTYKITSVIIREEVNNREVAFTFDFLLNKGKYYFLNGKQEDL